MARWFLLRGRLRELDTLDRGQAGWRRVLSSRQASDGKACGSGPRRAVRASRVINGRVGQPVVPGALLDVGGATACSSCLHHQPCEKTATNWTAGWQTRPFEAAGEAPSAKEAWRAVGLPDANPRALAGPAS